MRKKFTRFNTTGIKEELEKIITHNTIVVCIGTPRVIGDSIGPLIGTNLKWLNTKIPIIGTYDEPVHALNIYEKIKYIKKKYGNSHILAIDACISTGEAKLYNVIIQDEGIKPGAGCGKDLPIIGNHCIKIITGKTANSLEEKGNYKILFKQANFIAKTLDDIYNQKLKEVEQNENRQQIMQNAQ